MKAFIFLAMIFCHVLDDYKIQAGVLNNLKQKSWWKDQTPEGVPKEFYEYDYIVALIMHAMSWSFMTHFPIAIYYGFNVSGWFIISFTLNALCHAFIDDLKANRHEINLLGDQILHMVQITITYFTMI